VLAQTVFSDPSLYMRDSWPERKNGWHRQVLWSESLHFLKICTLKSNLQCNAIKAHGHGDAIIANMWD
jgi:hypothetical protein